MNIIGSFLKILAVLLLSIAFTHTISLAVYQPLTFSFVLSAFYDSLFFFNRFMQEYANIALIFTICIFIPKKVNDNCRIGALFKYFC